MQGWRGGDQVSGGKINEMGKDVPFRGGQKGGGNVSVDPAGEAMPTVCTVEVTDIPSVLAMHTRRYAR